MKLTKGNSFSVGIQMAWKSHYITINIIKQTFQFIHAKVQESNNKVWFFSAIYANPNSNMKVILWQDLFEINRQMEGYQLVAMDLNDIKDPQEKKGEALFN